MTTFDALVSITQVLVRVKFGDTPRENEIGVMHARACKLIGGTHADAVNSYEELLRRYGYMMADANIPTV